DLLVHKALLAVVGDRGKAAIEGVELLAGQVVAELSGALPKGVAAAVLAEHELTFGYAYGAGVDDLVRTFFLEVAVLVNAGLVRESVPSNDGFIGLRPECDQRAQQFARAK